MRKVLVVAPAADTPEALGLREEQTKQAKVADDISFHFRPAKVKHLIYGSYHDDLLMHLGVLEAGIDAESEGFDAVVIDTMSDSGLPYLRSVLDIPVIGTGQAAFHTALLLGRKFSIVTLWHGWTRQYESCLGNYDLLDHCASIRATDNDPNLSTYLTGKEEDVFPELVEVSLRCIEEDGADVICVGSSSMFQAHAYMAEHLPVPVTSPGASALKMVETVLDMGLTHSRHAYRRADAPQGEKLHRMLDVY
jgi:allantoin racemase